MLINNETVKEMELAKMELVFEVFDKLDIPSKAMLTEDLMYIRYGVVVTVKKGTEFLVETERAVAVIGDDVLTEIDPRKYKLIHLN